MFLTDARELGAREVAPDALLVKLPKKKRKIKKSNKSEENPENRKKVLVDPGRHFPVPYFVLRTAPQRDRLDPALGPSRVPLI